MTLTTPQRTALAALADVIAPASGRMPAASSIGLVDPGGQVEQVLALRPDLAAALPPILAATGSDAAEALTRMPPVWRTTLLECIAGAYYLHPEVRRLIDYAGQEALSLGRGEIGAEDLLAEMMERPSRWRQPPGDRVDVEP